MGTVNEKHMRAEGKIATSFVNTGEKSLPGAGGGQAQPEMKFLGTARVPFAPQQVFNYRY